MTPLWHAPVAAFLRATPAAVADALNGAATRHYLTTEAAQLRAWEASVRLLQAALAATPGSAGWHVLLELPLLRLQKRIDAVLLTDRAILVIEFKVGAQGYAAADLAQVDDYALDLHDFHAGSRGFPIVPILVAPDAGDRKLQPPFLWQAVEPVLCANARMLPAVLALATRAPPAPTRLVADTWLAAPYRPVPNVIEAASMLYARNGVAELRDARAELGNLRGTTDAIAASIATARQAGRRIAVFVTGIPGAGKTLCGLNAAFGTPVADGATYLTGNPTLVHVLREGLARDAATGASRAMLAAARHRTQAAIQALPAFRDHHVASGETPAERVIVVDEAQRCWDSAHAVRKTAMRAVRLAQSEAAHLLDAMARHAGWCAVVCLVGGGQEIHDGEGGLREWALALAARPDWQVMASPLVQQAQDPRQRLDAVPADRLALDPALHLDVAVRSIRGPQAATWVDAVLRNDAAAARAIATPVPFLLTRSLAAMRAGLRARARGLRRAGLVCSAGARRLRAEGLGVELPHMNAAAVADWFLDRWPDVRASDALEVCATEFSCQGLELDHVGLAWGGDLVRAADAWRVRKFRGTRWTLPTGAEAIANQVNTYRVLLTRARYDTIIWVPPGDDADATRRPAEMDAIADFLLACGVAPLEALEVQPEAVPLLL
jgi:hypothetical protein